jgi:LuxR family maltose regulon positive regulatory protein
MRSWIAEAGLAARAAWVPVDSEEHDPRRFWISVADALRGTAAGSALVQALTAAPDLDGWAIVERLLTDLAPLKDRLWLVIDDVHLLGPGGVLPQLELLVLRAPPQLRFVLVTRHDLQLGLHRLRLKGELTEIRAADLRFSLAEARALFGAAGVDLPAGALARLHERTEGWAAGLRLAALSLAAHPDPERFAAEFSGSERTVAEYLLAEVLDRQSEEVRRLLLRTSFLERVNGDLADLLTGTSGGERILQDLEQAGAFVVSLDGRRSWFRYHRLFADLLQLELRRTEPNERVALHGAAAGWLAGHGHPIEAVRQAQAAEDWELAARLLCDHWLDLYLAGRGPILVELLAGFPGQVVADSPELTVVQVAGDLIGKSLDDAGRHLAVASDALAAVPADRRGRVQVMLSVLRLFLARRLVDFPVVAEEAQRLLSLTEGADAAQPGLGEDLRATAFISLGIAEMWALRFEDAERHLTQGLALAREIGRPYLELHGLAHGAHAMLQFRPDTSQAERSTQAIELAERHGWGEEPLAGVAYTQLGIVLLYQGRLEEAEPWLERAEQTLRAEVEPAAGMSLRHARAVLELARGRYQEALAAFRRAERLAATLVTQHTSVTSMRSRMLHTLARAGQTGRAEQALAELGEDERASAEMRTAAAALRLAAGDPQAAADALAPVLDGSVPGVRQVQTVTALLLDARARGALGDQGTAGRVLERALDITESTGILLPFLLDPAPALLERHRRYRTAHPALISQILDLLSEPRSAPPGGQAGWAYSHGLDEQLTDSETRILRYLPTHLTGREIANELSVSLNTVSTHMQHLYAKLGVHRRHEAVHRARALGLLAPRMKGLRRNHPMRANPLHAPRTEPDSFGPFVQVKGSPFDSLHGDRLRRTGRSSRAAAANACGRPPAAAAPARRTAEDRSRAWKVAGRRSGAWLVNVERDGFGADHRERCRFRRRGRVQGPVGENLHPVAGRGVQVIATGQGIGRWSGQGNVQRVRGGGQPAQVDRKPKPSCLYSVRVPRPSEAATFRPPACPAAWRAGRSCRRSGQGGSGRAPRRSPRRRRCPGRRALPCTGRRPAVPGRCRGRDRSPAGPRGPRRTRSASGWAPCRRWTVALQGLGDRCTGQHLDSAPPEHPVSGLR